MPVVSLSDQKDIALEITVTNQNGDDAHEAALIASFPPSLSYSASRSAPNAVSDTSPLLSHALSRSFPSSVLQTGYRVVTGCFVDCRTSR